MSDFYQILVIAVPARGVTACAKRVLGYLRNRDIIANRAHRRHRDVVAILRRHRERWLRSFGLKGKELARRLDATDAVELARRWWSLSEGARAVAADVTVDNTDAAYGVELVRGRQIHTDVNLPTVARCPACTATTPDLKWWESPLADAASAFDDNAAAPLACSRCHALSPLATWQFDPPAIAGELALRFGNVGDLKASFVRELEKIARYSTHRAYERV